MAFTVSNTVPRLVCLGGFAGEQEDLASVACCATLN